MAYAALRKAGLVPVSYTHLYAAVCINNNTSGVAWIRRFNGQWFRFFCFLLLPRRCVLLLPVVRNGKNDKCRHEKGNGN